MVAAPPFALIAISGLLFDADPSGQYSSIASALTFTGAMLGGVAGVVAMRRFSPSAIALALPGAGAAISLVCLSLDAMLPMVLLPALMALQALQVVDAANSAHAIEESVDSNMRISVHAKSQLASTVVAIGTPLIAYAMLDFSTAYSFFFLLAIYAVTASMRLGARSLFAKSRDSSPDREITFRWFVNDPLLLRFTTFRVMSSCAHAATFVAIPLFCVRASEGSGDPAQMQTVLMASAGAGFLLGHLAIRRHLAKPKATSVLVWLGCLGCSASWVSIAFANAPALAVCACLTHGFSLYALRMSGVLLGRTITPPDVFGSVVLIGDTLTRGASMLVGLCAAWLLSQISDSLLKAAFVASLAVVALSAASFATSTIAAARRLGERGHSLY